MPVLVLVSFMLHFLKFLYFFFKSFLMALMHTLIDAVSYTHLTLPTKRIV